MSNAQPILNTASAFEQLWNIANEIHQKLEARFELHPEPCTNDLQEFSSLDGNFMGSLRAFSGPEIDWLIRARLGNPEKLNFGTMRLTTWLRSHVRVPHLAFEFGTVPHVFFYMDYIPRSDLLTDLESFDRYYEPLNQTYLTFQSDSRFVPFISKSAYIRLFQSPVNLCYTCQATEETLQLIRTVANEMADRWLQWVDEAERVPEEARAVLSDRDLFVRRSSAERDPDNGKVVHLFGAELTDKLVRALWGGDRANP